MKKLTLLKSLFLLCALIVGTSSSWASEITISTTMSDYASAHSWTTSTSGNEVCYTSFDLDSHINISTTGDANCGSFWGSDWRLYRAKDGNLIITAGTNCTLKSATITFTLANNGALKYGSTTLTSGTAVNLSGNSVEFTVVNTNNKNNAQAKVTAISVTYDYYDPSDTRTTPSWTVTPSSAEMVSGNSVELAITTDYDGTLSFMPTDASIATCNYNSSSKKLTINGLKAGTTTIQATGEATVAYKAINKTIDVIVSVNEIPHNAIETVANLGYNFWDEITSSGSTSNEINGAQNGVSFNVVKGEGNAPRADGIYFRFYQKNVMTITAPSNCYITKIEFKEPSSNAEWNGTIIPEEGIYYNDIKTWYAESLINSIVLTGKTGTNRIGGMVIYLAKPATATITAAAKYATFVNACNTNFDGTGITVYTATDNENTVTLNEITSGKVPAGTPVVLYKEGADGTAINVPVIASATAIEGTNDLRVSTGTDVDDMYVLAMNPTIGFYPWTGTNLPAGKIYLQGKASYGARSFIGFDSNTTTEIDNVVVKPVEDNAPMYNLAGQRVNKSYKGVVIVNGKKMLNK